jgi:hypothetical protein
VSEPARVTPADEATRARLRALHEEPLPREEFLRRLALPISEAERETTLELIRWFRRRYPTPLERLAWARRAQKRWLRAAERG